MFVPRAKLYVAVDPGTHLYELQFTEDVINRQDQQSLDNSKNSHMLHGLGCWDIDKTYWLNFHQQKRTVTELAQIAKMINFLY